MIYIVIVFILLILAIQYDNRIKNTSGDKWYWLVYVVLVCLVGFSRDIGGDKQNYENAFSYCVVWSDGWSVVEQYIVAQFLQGYMPLWSVFQISCKTLSNEFYVTQMVHAAVINYIFFKFFKDYSESKFLCVFFYFIFCFYDFNFDILRRGLSIAIGVLAMKQLLNKNYVRYYFFASVSFMVHVAGFILLILPLIKPFKATKKNICIIVVSTIILYFVISSILFNVINTFSLYTGIYRYNSYIETSLNIYGLLFTIIKFILVPWFIINKLRLDYRVSNIKIASCIYLYFGLCILIIPITTLSYCFDYFFALAIIFFSDYIRTSYKNRNVSSKITCVLIVSVFILRCVDYYSHPYGEYKNYEFFYPYTSIFDNQNTDYRTEMRYIGFSNGPIDNKRE